MKNYRNHFFSTNFTTDNILTAHTSQTAIRTVTVTVTKVSEGDTIHLTIQEQTKLKVKLYSIDAPETDKINHRTAQVNKPVQPYGEESLAEKEARLVKKGIWSLPEYERP